MLKPALICLALILGAVSPALADAGVPIVAPFIDAGPTAAEAAPILPAEVLPDPEPTDLAQDVYRGITGKDWFLVAGGILSLVVLGVRWLLAKRWPAVEGKLYGIALVAVLAGLGALGNAWIADERLTSTTTLIGAVKVWASAVFLYVTSKKLFANTSEPAA